MNTNDTPPVRPEIVEVSRAELLARRAVLLDRIDPDIRAELEGIDFLLGDGAASAAPETSPAPKSLQDLTKRWADLVDVAIETEDWTLVETVRDNIHQVHGDAWARAAAPVAADPAGETRTEWAVTRPDGYLGSYGENEALARRVAAQAGEQVVQRQVGPRTPATPTTDTSSREG